MGLLQLDPAGYDRLAVPHTAGASADTPPLMRTRLDLLTGGAISAIVIGCISGTVALLVAVFFALWYFRKARCDKGCVIALGYLASYKQCALATLIKLENGMLGSPRWVS